MVDAGVTTQQSRMMRQAANAEIASAAIDVEVRAADDVALADYETFCRNAVHAPAQHPIWIRSWIMATGADVVIATIHRDGRPTCALALEIVREGAFRIARFVGGSHANGNFAAAIPTEGAAPLSDDRVLAEAIRAARPDIDLIFLERQNPRHDGMSNPLSELATMRSPNISLATNLDGGFEAMLARMSGKRKRKKYRLQKRKFEEAGGYRFVDPTTPEEVKTLIDDFFVMKASRFARKGIPDAFAATEVRNFFRLLFQDALKHEPPPFTLRGLEVNGELRAVNGLSITGMSHVCEFGGIRDSDPGTSPGFFLDYDTVQIACERGKQLFDFSVGDEDYKRSWCDVETWQFDTLLPLSLKGRVVRAYKIARSRTVRFVKSNAALWSLTKQLREKAIGVKPAHND